MKKSVSSDKVAIVDCRARLIAPFLAELAPDDMRALEQILAEWDTERLDWAQNFGEIVNLALRRLQWELDSGCKDEVIEDVQREIAYRLWCAGTG